MYPISRNIVDIFFQVASGLTTCVAYGVSFFVLKMYPHMKDVLDKHGVFYFFGTMSCLGTLFVVLFLPETEGKTLQEIQDQFIKKSKYYFNKVLLSTCSENSVIDYTIKKT